MDPKLIIRRLALIRYLYNNAVNQSRQPEPMGATSILTFHDSVELFLGLACEHFNVGKSSMNFMDYWEAINPKLKPDSLEQKMSMSRMNKSRVILKHHGTLPTKPDVEAFRANTTSFFEENTPLVFGLNFGDISMVDLVQCEEARNRLQKGNASLENGELEEAFTQIAIGFEKLLDYYVREKWAVNGSPLLALGGSFHLGHSYSSSEDRGMDFFARDVGESIEAIQKVTNILALGLDYRSYVKFRFLLPILTITTFGGTVHVQRKGGMELPSLEGYRFCHDFVIESALRLQEFDLELNIENG